jgi:hypothetical protein
LTCRDDDGNLSTLASLWVQPIATYISQKNFLNAFKFPIYELHLEKDIRAAASSNKLPNIV